MPAAPGGDRRQMAAANLIGRRAIGQSSWAATRDGTTRTRRTCRWVLHVSGDRRLPGHPPLRLVMSRRFRADLPEEGRQSARIGNCGPGWIVHPLRLRAGAGPAGDGRTAGKGVNTTGSSTMGTREVVERYCDSLKGKQGWEALIADDMRFTSFTSPVKRVAGRGAYLEATRRFFSMVNVSLPRFGGHLPEPPSWRQEVSDEASSPTGL